MSTFFITDLLVETFRPSYDTFGRYITYRITHIPTKVAVEDTYDTHKIDLNASKIALVKRLEERLRNGKGLLFCHVCEKINELDALSCQFCNAQVLTRL